MQAQVNTQSMLAESCRNVASELIARYEGRVYMDQEGDYHTVANGEDVPEDWEQQDISDYVADCLDYRVMCDSQGKPIYTVLCAAIGGPNIWVDCGFNEVKGYWGADMASAYLPSEVCDEITDYITEIWEVAA